MKPVFENGLWCAKKDNGEVVYRNADKEKVMLFMMKGFFNNTL